LPLTAGFRRKAGLSSSASAAIFVVRAALDVTTATELIATECLLTPTELRVLRAVAEIGGVADIASALGVSEETTRTHLRHLTISAIPTNSLNAIREGRSFEAVTSVRSVISILPLDRAAKGLLGAGHSRP
jgi:Bacterial regulatory proteins, luxR family